MEDKAFLVMLESQKCTNNHVHALKPEIGFLRRVTVQCSTFRFFTRLIILELLL